MAAIQLNSTPVITCDHLFIFYDIVIILRTCQFEVIKKNIIIIMYPADIDRNVYIYVRNCCSFTSSLSLVGSHSLRELPLFKSPVT